jgi:hypothetical protein
MSASVEAEMRTLLKNARALWLILEAAELRGLPMPFSAEATDCTTHLRLLFMSRDQVVTWAEVLEAEVEDGAFTHAGGVNDTARARGEWLDVPLEVVCHTPRSLS